MLLDIETKCSEILLSRFVLKCPFLEFDKFLRKNTVFKKIFLDI